MIPLGSVSHASRIAAGVVYPMGWANPARVYPWTR